MTLVDRDAPPGTPTPVDLDLEKVLGGPNTELFASRLLSVIQALPEAAVHSPATCAKVRGRAHLWPFWFFSLDLKAHQTSRPYAGR